MRLAGFAMFVPIAALAGVTTGGADRAAGRYQLRCWQHGRLLFEENQIALPADNARYGVRMAGQDREGRPLFVVETKNATCLIRSAVEEHGRPAAPAR
jgi:hypothetical protein